MQVREPFALTLREPMGIIEQIASFENLKLAYKKVMKGNAKHTTEAIEFSIFWFRNLKEIQQQLLTNTYEFDDYYSFLVYEPKMREIDAPSFRDKIVHHAINNVLIDIYEPTFHSNSFACIRGKGNQRAVSKLHSLLRKHTKNNKSTCYIKIDIFKFFPSIDKSILIETLKRKIKCNKTIALIYKFLYGYKKSGIPLGSVISQLLANIYMNNVDFFVSKVLSIRNYIRYADDIFILQKSIEVARELKTKIVHFIYSKLNLQVGRGKSFTKNTKNGIAGLGHVTFHNKITILYKSFKKIKNFFNIKNPTKKQIQSHNSRIGVFKVASCC